MNLNLSLEEALLHSDHRVHEGQGQTEEEKYQICYDRLVRNLLCFVSMKDEAHLVASRSMAETWRKQMITVSFSHAGRM